MARTGHEEENWRPCTSGERVLAGTLCTDNRRFPFQRCPFEEQKRDSDKVLARDEPVRLVAMTTAAAELEALLRDAGAKPSGHVASAALAIVRRAPLHRPDLALALGEAAQRSHGADTVAYWDIVEQRLRAAAACGQPALLSRLSDLIRARFPRSWRADLLLAECAEARGAWGAALRVYMRLVEEEPLRLAAYKRQVAVLKAQRRVPEAIALLNYVLRHFSTDIDCWAELAALCLAEGRMEHALFAANEVLIHSPSKFAAHVLIADVQMTMGGYQNFLSARRHYSASVNARRKGNMRGLYGMWLAASALNRVDSWKERGYDEADESSVEGRGVENGDGGGDEGSQSCDDDGGNKPASEKRKRENDRVLAWATAAINSTYNNIDAGASAATTAKEKTAKGKSSATCVSMAVVVRAALETKLECVVR